ncbi:PASTA domain-containing protein [Nocardioides sp. YIM 152588]|uniref:PASTA domain-containing protein n=1 Tax=Nocardioides sp. YIM 152588 TaxID=3158259 RepID=UPI0032E52B15
MLLCLPIGLVGLWRRAASSTTTKAWVTIVALALWGLALAVPSEEEPTPVAADSVVTPAEVPTTSAPPTPTAPTTVTVPVVTGLTLKKAKEVLGADGLGDVVAEKVPSRKPAGTILRIQPAEASEVAPGASVQLWVAAPLPSVPDVVGLGRANALSQLKRAGFATRVTQRRTTSGRDNVALSQSPVAGKQVRPGTLVKVVVSDLHEPPPAPEPEPEPQNCTPGYSPCLPPASDYDCAGGSGNGPAYTGTVRVDGPDIYDLDRDGDGIGCD